MQRSISFTKSTWQPYLLLLLTTSFVYWPLTLGIFSLKNDALIYFLPWRYHISEAIQQGHFPFWSPYLYTGLPLHSDMQSGTWNPVVLMISLFTRYNMQVLQWELLLYIFLAGVGIYKLIKETGYSSTTAVIGAISYMCCGFITDSGSFIPWITCAAYLPFVFVYFYRLLKKPSFMDSIKLALTSFQLLTAGNPSYLIYTCYILLAAFLCWIVIHRRQQKIILQVVKSLLLAGLLFLFLALPVIISFVEFLSYYKRGEGANLHQALTDPFNIFCSISYLLPSAVSKPHEWFSTDMAMRNAYVGIFILLFFLVSFTNRFTLLQKFILGTTIFSFAFSLGDAIPLRKWCYQLLPLMDSFRHPAIIRVFTSIGIILLAASALDAFLKDNNTGKKLKQAAIFLGILLFSFVIYYWFAGDFTNPLGHDKDIKQLLDSLRFSDIAIIQGIIQLIFIIAFLLFIRKKKIVLLLMTANVIVFAFMALPFTFVSQMKPGAISRYINSYPKNFPLPSLTDPIESNTYTNTATDTKYGYSKFYNKKITIQDNIISPTVNTDYYKFLENSPLRVRLDQVPFAYISSEGKFIDSAARLSIKEFYPSHFTFTVIAPTNGYLNLFQQYHHNWKATINDQSVKIEKANIAFMKVNVPAGNTVVRFEYKPKKIIYITMYISAILLLALVIYLVIIYWKKIVSRNKKNLI